MHLNRELLNTEKTTLYVHKEKFIKENRKQLQKTVNHLRTLQPTSDARERAQDHNVHPNSVIFT